MKITGVKTGNVVLTISKTEQDRLLIDKRYREYVINNIACALEDAKTLYIEPIEVKVEDNEEHNDTHTE